MASRAEAIPVRGGVGRKDAAPSPFILGRLPDNFWIILSPFVALGVMAAAWRWSGLSDMAVFSILFGLIVTGHHMPGWIRAFGEPAVYERHKARLWVSLLAIPVLVVLPAIYGLGVVGLTIAAAFDLWHVAMQQHGFGRIYAAKAGDVARRSARLDLACVLTWYVTVVAWSDSWMEGIARAFRKAGLPIFDLLSRSGWRAIQLALLAISLVLLAAYVANAVAVWKAKRIATPNKHLLHLAAFSVLIWTYQFPSWYRAQSVQNLFHASQYFFMVWIYGNLSIRRDATRPGSLYRLVFQTRRGMLLFAGLVALYGIGAYFLFSSGYRLIGGDAERTMQVIGSIALDVAAAPLLRGFLHLEGAVPRRSVPALAIRDGELAATPVAPVSPRAMQFGTRSTPSRISAFPFFWSSSSAPAAGGFPSSRARADCARDGPLPAKRAGPGTTSARRPWRWVTARRRARELSAAFALAPTFEGPARRRSRTSTTARGTRRV